MARILVDARLGWGHGIGRVIANTVPRVARDRPDWTLDVLVGSADMARAAQAFDGHDNLRVRRCDIRPFSLREQTGLARYRDGHDLTWFTNYWVPLGWRGRFVTTVHDLLHLMPALLPASRLRRLLARRTFIKSRRDAAAVVFVSRFTQAAFTALIGAPRSGRVVHLGGDHLDAGHTASALIAAKKKRLLVVAAAKRHKNFPLLLDAWRRSAVHPDWRLTVVTPDEVLRSSIDLEGLTTATGRVEIRQGVSNEELSRLYEESAILLMPSLYEGFGLPLLEGMLAGSLCLSANAGAMVEVAQGAFVQFVNATDGAGWVEAIEQACRLFDDGFDFRPIVAHNLERARRFTWDDTATRIASVLDGALR